ncbi:hypothetical protein [Paenibacillus oceani]|uniref:Uncharacterized protein n=1 Tax=Paenibacillus oceani TaxID=2772510 RepID=A0A927C4P0_9BACL|nr:hypothetical protein [Paenibacillus oceani]MBD2861283.1 hypothetical protein [Paenibacillus oceani]
MEYTPAEAVWNVRPVRWELAAENEMSRRFYGVLLRWIPFAVKQYGVWDGRPECGHFFGGTFWYQADSAHVSAIFAAMSKLGEYDESVAGVPRSELKRMAVSAIRYMGFTHDTGPADCVRAQGVLPYTSGKKWGGRGDGFFMASQNGRSVAAMACAAWLLWDELDGETKRLVQNVTSSYADRWAAEEPRNGVYYDTQCEENAWTAAGISAAMGMFPDHPHQQEWQAGFTNWAMNAVTTYRDRLAYPSGLIDKTNGLKVTTVTFHPDYTSENHAFVHPSYYCAGTNLRAIHAVFALMSGQPVMESALYNNVPLYERTVKIWSQFDGLNIPVQGQDWWYNRQHERQLTHTILNVLGGDPDAARLARSSLDSIERIQASNSIGALLEENGEECVINRDHGQFAKDLEHGSAYDLAVSYLLHVFGGAGACPSEPAELAERLSGVHLYPFGGSVIHRTPSTFTSFTWRNNVMGLSMPAKGVWNVTPLYASYTGTMKLESSGTSPGSLTNESIIRGVEKEQISPYTDGFGAVVEISRGHGDLKQDVAFVALPDGRSVYVERFRVQKACAVREWQTGTIGIRNEHYSAMPELAPGSRTLYMMDGERTFRGFYGREADEVRSFGPVPYVNMDHTIGYLLYGTRGVRYVNRHVYPKWKGVEDILVLNDFGDRTFDQPQTLEPSVIVALPNRTAEETAASYDRTHRYDTGRSDLTVLETEGTFVYASFAESDQTVSVRKAADALGTIDLYDGIQTLDEDSFVWSGTIPGFRAGYCVSRYSVTEAKGPELRLELSVNAGQLLVLNHSSGQAAVTIRDRVTGASYAAVLEAGAFRKYQA